MQRFSPHECLVLSACELDAEMSAKNIAKRTGLRPHNVSYVLRTLQSRETIRIKPFVNLMALGFRDYGIYFSLASKTSRDRERIEQQIIKHPSVAWLGKFAGEFQYGLAFLARQPEEIELFFSTLEAQFGEVVARKSVCPRLRFRLFPRKYLCASTKRAAIQERLFASTSEVIELDEVDLKIITSLDALSEISLRRVAQTLGMSPSTVERRIAELKRREVLLGFFYDINPLAIGVEVYRLLFSWSGGLERKRSDVLDFCRAHAQVVFFNEQLGRWDFEIGLEATRASDVSKFHEELLAKFGSSIVELNIMTEVSTLKWSFMPPGSQL